MFDGEGDGRYVELMVLKMERRWKLREESGSRHSQDTHTARVREVFGLGVGGWMYGFFLGLAGEHGEFTQQRAQAGGWPDFAVDGSVVGPGCVWASTYMLHSCWDSRAENRAQNEAC